MRIDKCEWCGAPIERAATGRRKRFCDGRCRVAAHRSRQDAFELPETSDDDLPPLPGDVGAALTGTAASTDEQVCAAILAVSTCEITLARLGREARPELGWRCAMFSAAIAEARRKFFEGVLP